MRRSAGRDDDADSRASPIFSTAGIDRAGGDLTRYRARGPDPRAPRLSGGRDLRLQAWRAADEGLLLALGYSTQRGYGRIHPSSAKSASAWSMSRWRSPELGFAVRIGRVASPNARWSRNSRARRRAAAVHTRLRPRLRPERTQGDGDEPGRSGAAGRRIRRAAQCPRPGRGIRAVEHGDNVQATGFVEHLKLPHYVDFQAELDLVRRLRREAAKP